MAIFGFQLCFTVIMASFLQKLSPILSLGRWILCNGSLVRYLHPPNEELRKLAVKENSTKHKNNRNVIKRKQQNPKTTTEKTSSGLETFKIQKNANLTLDTSKITEMDTIVLMKYDEYEWMVNYFLYTVIVYIVTEVYYEWWQPAPEFNISMIWAFLAIGFVLKNLFSIMTLYFKTETGELSTCVTFGCFSFVAAMAVLTVDENILEFGLDSAYDAFVQNSSALAMELDEKSGPRPAPISLPLIKIGVSFISGLFGTLLAFPGIRTAQMYVDGLKYSKSNQLVHLLIHINYLTPLIIACLWVKPIARDLLCPSLDDPASSAILTHKQFDIIRIIFILFLCLLKLFAIRIHLQSYLNIAFVKLRMLRREAGFTTNVEIQRLVTRVFYYLCIVTLQYLAPVFLVILFTFMLKTQGNHSWMQVRSDYIENTSTLNHTTISSIDEDSSFKEMVAHAGISLSRISSVFTPLVFRGILSFVLWWVCTSWFLASCFGIVYHQYLAASY